MDCNDYKNRIVPYIDNELGDLDKKEFESELEKNSKLKEEYLEIKRDGNWLELDYTDI